MKNVQVTSWLGEHLIVVFFLLIHGRRRGLLLKKLFAVERAGRVEFQPRGNALQVEAVIRVAGKLDDKRVWI